MQARAIQAGIDQGMLSDLLDPDELGRQIYHGYELASLRWALGAIDADTFEARALYGLEVALLGIASDALRPELECELMRLEQRLDAPASHHSPRPARRA
jgi:hypothetical protein